MGHSTADIPVKHCPHLRFIWRPTVSGPRAVRTRCLLDSTWTPLNCISSPSHRWQKQELKYRTADWLLYCDVCYLTHRLYFAWNAMYDISSLWQIDWIDGWIGALTRFTCYGPTASRPNGVPPNFCCLKRCLCLFDAHANVVSAPHMATFSI